MVMAMDGHGLQNIKNRWVVVFHETMNLPTLRIRTLKTSCYRGYKAL